MTKDPARTSGGSWAVQGCLYGAVAIFIILLMVMLFLTYRLYLERTQTPENGAATTSAVTWARAADHPGGNV